MKSIGIIAFLLFTVVVGFFLIKPNPIVIEAATDSKHIQVEVLEPIIETQSVEIEVTAEPCNTFSNQDSQCRSIVGTRSMEK